MTPIRPEERDRYPADWAAISHRVRFTRAGGRCECTGECGVHHRAEGDQRCHLRHGDPLPSGRWHVVLTTAHLDHTPENVDDTNLLAMCAGCHLRYDAAHHAETRRARRAQDGPMLW